MLLAILADNIKVDAIAARCPFEIKRSLVLYLSPTVPVLKHLSYQVGIVSPPYHISVLASCLLWNLLIE